MYSKVYGRVRGSGSRRDARLPPPPPPTLPDRYLYVCEHFANKVRELLVNIASEGSAIEVDKCRHCFYADSEKGLYVNTLC
jgi:hypothetical protein